MIGLFTEEEARRLCERALGKSGADAASVRLSADLIGHTRFARNEITTSGDTTDARLTVSAHFGSKSASVVVNDLSDAGIGAAVSRSEELARFAPADSEWVGLLSAQAYEGREGFFERTRDLSASERTAAVQEIAEPAAQSGLMAAGFLQRRAASLAIANSDGLFGYDRSTLASLTTTVRTADGTGSGWAGTAHNDWARVTPAARLAEQAIAKATRSVDADAVEPGAYTVVLEPTAVGNLVQLVASDLNGRAADEGRSFFAKRGGGTKLGEQVVDERLSLISDPQDPDLLTGTFGPDGQPLGKTVWIDSGVLKNLSYSRYWSQRQGIRAVPPPDGLKLIGGNGSVDELVGTVERGLLVTRFWYIRAVSRRTLLYTGLTRDGTFRIEDGQITGAVKNLRFNESPMAMLNNVEAIGSAVRVVASESGNAGRAVVVPPLVVRDFHFTSVSDAV